MPDWFAVHHLDVERLLVDWHWLCKEPMALVARNAFGDLFLRGESGDVHQLDVAIGKLTKVAASEQEFRELALTSERQEEWFAVTDEKAAIARGLESSETQCIGFSVSLFLPKAALLIQPTLLTSMNTSLSLGLEPSNFGLARRSQGPTSH